jgi:RNA polymerase sigma factor (sigma-70 family)
LIDRIRLGDEEAVEQLMAEYATPIRNAIRVRLARYRLRQQFDTNDILQSLLGAICRTSTEAATAWEFKTSDDLRNFLLKAACRNIMKKLRAAYTQRRGQHHQVSNSDGVLVSVPTGGPVSEDVVENRDLIEAVLQRLNDDEKRLFTLRLVEDRSWDEIGASVGKTGESCRKQLMRVLDRVVTTWQSKGTTDG